MRSLGMYSKMIKLAHAQQNSDAALDAVCKAIPEIIEHFDARINEANRLIAHNMLAVVRLEIANCGDAITNAILEVKREKTGSGTAALVINVTGTLAMIGGSVLTGGGMAVLGGILASAGNAAIAASNNDAAGVIGHTASGASAGIVAKADGKGVTDGFNLKKQSANPTGASQAKKISDVSNAGISGVTKLAKLKSSNPSEENGYVRKCKKTCFVSHGSGGTNAISFDVQQAIAEAYHETITKLGEDIEKLETGTTSSGTSLIAQIAGSAFPSSDSNMKTDLHPLTKHVLIKALTKLQDFKGEYSQVKGSTFTRASTRKAAQQHVTEGYKKLLGICIAGEPLPNGRTLVNLLR